MSNMKAERVAHQATVGNMTVRALLRLIGKKYDEKRGFEPFRKRHMVVVRAFFDEECCYCGTRLNNGKSEQDHLIPMNMTECGLHAWGNVVPCCDECNDKKHGTPWELYRAEIAPNYAKRIDQFQIRYKYEFESAKLASVAKSLHHKIGESMLNLVLQSVGQFESD